MAHKNESSKLLWHEALGKEIFYKNWTFDLGNEEAVKLKPGALKAWLNLVMEIYLNKDTTNSNTLETMSIVFVCFGRESNEICAFNNWTGGSKAVNLLSSVVYQKLQ